MKDEDIVGLFFEISKLNKRYAAQHRELYPAEGQYRCLLALSYQGPMEQKRLASLLDIRATSLSESVKKLENKGMVRREPSKTDKRTFIISLTEKGIEAAQRCDTIRAKNSCKMIETLDEGEKEQLARLLGKMRDGSLKEENR